MYQLNKIINLGGDVMNMGDKVKEKRLEKGWTQEQLGNILNVSRSAVSSWEVGRNYPDLETIISISDLFEIPLDNLLREDKEVAKDMSKKIKMNSYYNFIFKILVIIVVLYLCGGLYSKINEKIYLKNLEKNHWKAYTGTRNGESKSKQYELMEGDIDYYINLANMGNIYNLIKKEKLKIITRKDNLVIEVEDESNIELIISKLNDPSATENINLKVNQNLKPSDKIFDNTQLISEQTNDLTMEYVNKNKRAYQEMINKTLEKLEEIK